MAADFETSVMSDERLEFRRTRPRVLLVEDEKPIRDAVVLMLFTAGYDCREAASGTSAIELLKSGTRIDLVLSNFLLPEVDGFTLLLHVKQHYSRIPFVFMTAIRDQGVRADAVEHGADGFVFKPFYVEDLLSVIHRVLGKP